MGSSGLMRVSEPDSEHLERTPVKRVEAPAKIAVTVREPMAVEVIGAAGGTIEEFQARSRQQE